MNTQRIVITGINGFVGHHLAQNLASQGISVIGIGQDESVAPEISDIVAEYHPANLVEEWPSINDIDGVIHLAGLAAVGPSFDHPQRYINANSAMVTNMCEFFLTQEKKPRILVISSGAIYSPDQEMPITESSEIGFSSPYAVSKILTENQCIYYRKRGLDCVIARPFNHIGPGQAPGFILPDLYEQLKASKESGKMLVGNLETKRDYTDVRDIVTAYSKIITAKSLKYDIYNICSGASHSGREILDLLQNNMQIDNVEVVVDQSKIRPNEIMDIVGSATRLTEELGWRPTYLIEQTVVDFLDSKK